MWEAIPGGRSGAVVLRGPGGIRKHSRTAALEAETLTWLRDQGLPAAEVLDLGPGWLLTREVIGRTAAQPWPVSDRERVIDALADITRALHSLPVDRCPFDRTLAGVSAEAETAVRSGTVDLDDLDPERHGQTAQQLLNALNDQLPGMLAREVPVVTHGDWCLPNVILDPESVEVVGILDTATLGRADRSTDLALMSRSLGSDRRNSQYGKSAAERFLTRYGHDRSDDDRLRFYRLLDEFF